MDYFQKKMDRGSLKRRKNNGDAPRGARPQGGEGDSQCKHFKSQGSHFGTRGNPNDFLRNLSGWIGNLFGPHITKEEKSRSKRILILLKGDNKTREHKSFRMDNSKKKCITL